jgi:hypothetical protein
MLQFVLPAFDRWNIVCDRKIQTNYTYNHSECLGEVVEFTCSPLTTHLVGTSFHKKSEVI